MDAERKRSLWKARNRALRSLRIRHEKEYQDLLVMEQTRLGLEVDQSMRLRTLEVPEQ